MALKEGNGRDIPDENPVVVRRPLIRTIPTISAQEPQSSTVTKMVAGMLQVVHRIDHMDEDLVSLGVSMVKGFASVEEQISFLASKLGESTIDVQHLPAMRRREDSQSAIEDLSRHVSSNVREEAQKIVDDPDSTLDPETVTKLAENAVAKALRAQREDDKLKALEAEKAERDRIEAEKKEQEKADKARNKDFRRNLVIAIVASVIAGGFAIYGAYITGHESGHEKGVADTLQAAPPPVTVVLPATSASSVAPASKK